MTTEERIATLEARLDTLQEAHSTVSEQLAQAHLDQWQGRIDDLELQVHLGAADATDRITALTAELDERWGKVRQHASIAGSTTSEVTETMRLGLASAYKEVRDALIESRKQLR